MSVACDELDIELGLYHANYRYPVNEDGVIVGKCAFEPEKWSVLSSVEWNYLLKSRTDANLKNGFAIIGDVYGLVLLPDDWTMPEGVPDFLYEEVNEYTTEQWLNMESAGAVFLPAEGYRWGTTIFIDRVGVYWSSDVNKGTGTANCMDFDLRNNITVMDMSLHWGLFVRFVYRI